MFEKLKALPLDALAKKYVEIREQRVDAQRAFNAVDAKYEAAMETLSRVLLAKLNEAGALNTKTNHGTVYVFPRKTATIVDFDALWQHMKENDSPELLQRRVSISEVEAFNELNPKTPVPGLQLETIREARVRAK